MSKDLSFLGQTRRAESLEGAKDGLPPIVADLKVNRAEFLSYPKLTAAAVYAMTDAIRIATRESPLAMWQARHVANLLDRLGQTSQLVPLVSRGDVDMAPIDGTRQVGLFTKRIQQALVDREADVAVHSLKDLPTEFDERFRLAAVPDRETVLDSLVSKQAYSIDELPEEAVIGTGSRRRAAQLWSIRPDLDIRPIRGNVQTRLAKLRAGEFDAIMLAEAGLLRLQMADVERQPCSLEQLLPAPGQGALAIEVRSDDDVALAALAQLDQFESRLAVTAERTLLSNLNGGCLAPIAAHGLVDGDILRVKAVVLSTDGKTRIDEIGEVQHQGRVETAIELANSISETMKRQGALDLISRD